MKLAALAPALFVLVSMCGSPVPPPPGSVSGTVFYDANHNAIHDKCDEKMAGAPVIVTAADGQAIRANADADGTFRIEGAPIGELTLSLDAGENTWAWPVTTKPDGAAGIPVHVESNKETSGIEIGSASRTAFPTDSVSVLGVIFIDANENRVIDRDECDKRTPANFNGDIQYVSVGDRPFARVNVNGTFEVRSLDVPGVDESEDALAVRYVYGQSPLTELNTASDHPCFMHASPRPRYATNIYEADIAFNASSRYGEVSGVLFDDKNRDGKRDAGEPGVPNQVVYLNAQGITCGGDQTGNSGNDTTDETGAFTMSHVPLGVYGVEISEGKRPDDLPTTVTIAGWSPAMTVTLRADDLNVLDLPVRVEQTSTINVFAFDDANGDGVQDAGEEPVPGYWICARRSGSPADMPDRFYNQYDLACDTTDQSGIANLRPLLADEYQIFEEESHFASFDSSVPLLKRPPTQTVTLSDGEVASVSVPLQVLPIADQVIAPGAGTPVEFATCYSDPDWIQPPFEDAYAAAFAPYGGPPEEEARAIYDEHIYIGGDGGLNIWSALVVGQPDLTSLLPGCFDPAVYNGQLFVFVNYEPISVVSSAEVSQDSDSIDSVLQFVLRPRQSGLYAILLSAHPQSSYGRWQLFLDDQYNPIARRPYQGGYAYPGGVSGR